MLWNAGQVAETWICQALCNSNSQLLEQCGWLLWLTLVMLIKVIGHNSADPDQLASEEANWSGSTLFAKAGHIWVQQDKG